MKGSRMQVLIVTDEGAYGQLSAKAGDYEIFPQLLQRRLEGQVESIHEVLNTEAALQQMEASEDDSVVVFLSRGMLNTANRLVREHEKIRRVVVLTGLPPSKDGARDLHTRVIILDKRDLSEKAIREAVLG